MAYRQSGNTLCTGTAPLLQAEGPAVAGGLPLKAPEEPWRQQPDPRALMRPPGRRPLSRASRATLPKCLPASKYR